jgi:protein tyrosine phosphatase (PTP) superfamily phosphohydrolase (DUF442 family)
MLPHHSPGRDLTVAEAAEHGVAHLVAVLGAGSRLGRTIVPNLYRIDADLWRSNQPGRRRLGRLKAEGLRSVLSLRGDSDDAASVIEKRAAAEAGIPLHFVRMRATSCRSRRSCWTRSTSCGRLPKPLLIHCKSGADRTGLMVTIYLHVMKGVPLAEARRASFLALCPCKLGPAGIVHEVLDAYARGGGDRDRVRGLGQDALRPRGADPAVSGASLVSAGSAAA